MNRFFKLPAIALLAVLMVAPAAFAQRRGRGVVVVVPTFGFRYGPAWYGPGWFGWYGPVYGPYWVPRYPYRAAGFVKIETHAKDAAVYVDGGYAGPARKLKHFPLRPGDHTLELRDSSGRAFYNERIHVIAGRTLEIYPDEQPRSG